MKFEVYEKYLKEQQLNAEKAESLYMKKVETEQKYHELIAEYELTMAQSLKSGKDVTKALDAQDDKIAAAKREMERAKREYEVYGRISRDVSITKEDVVAAWNRDINPKHFDNKITPALDALLVAKEAYLDAVRDYFSAVREIKQFREEVSSQLGYDFPYYFHIKELQTTTEFNRYFVRQDDLDKAERGEK